MNKRKLLGLLCFLVAAAALAAAILLYGQSWQAAVLPTPRLTPSPTPTAEPSATPSPEPTPWPSADDGGFPQDKVFITEAREAYVSGTMRLIVPKLEIDIPILDGTSESTLLQGEGLDD